MKSVILLLYLKDVEYGKRLLRFLTGKKNPRLHPELVTAKERIKMRVGTELDELVVLTDCVDMKEDEKRKVIYLSNEQDKRTNKIFQFQKAESIYRELLALLQLEEENVAMQEDVREEAGKGVYCVFSPEGTGSTALAVMLAQYLGGQGKCLYLSLSGFPMFFSQELTPEPDFKEKGLGELLFHLNQEDFFQKQEEWKKPFGKAYMLAPMPHFKDLLDCSLQEWEQFLELILSKCGYDSVVVEMGQLFEYTLDLLERGDRIFIVKTPGICGRIQNAVFRRYCQMEKKEVLEQRAEFVELPFSRKEWEQEISAQPLDQMVENSQMMVYFREMIMGNRKGEEDVCIIEDAG